MNIRYTVPLIIAVGLLLTLAFAQDDGGFTDPNATVTFENPNHWEVVDTHRGVFLIDSESGRVFIYVQRPRRSDDRTTARFHGFLELEVSPLYPDDVIPEPPGE